MVFFLVLCYLIVSGVRVVKWGDFAHRGVISFRLLCCEYSLCEASDGSLRRFCVNFGNVDSVDFSGCEKYGIYI